MSCAFCAMCALRARSRGGFSPFNLSTTRTRKAQMPQMHGHALLVRLSAESRRNASATPGETGETRPRRGGFRLPTAAKVTGAAAFLSRVQLRNSVFRACTNRGGTTP